MFTHYKTFRKKTLSGKKNLRGQRYLQPTLLVDFYNTKIVNFSFFILNIHFFKHPLREACSAKTIYNHIRLFSQTELSYPGFKIHPTHVVNFQGPYINQVINLAQIPLNYTISSVFGSDNNKMAYAKSSGASAIRRKTLKKTKLVFVEMPSKKLKLLSETTLCVFSPTANLYVNL